MVDWFFAIARTRRPWVCWALGAALATGPSSSAGRYSLPRVRCRSTIRSSELPRRPPCQHRFQVAPCPASPATWRPLGCRTLPVWLSIAAAAWCRLLVGPGSRPSTVDDRGPDFRLVRVAVGLSALLRVVCGVGRERGLYHRRVGGVTVTAMQRPVLRDLGPGVLWLSGAGAISAVAGDADGQRCFRCRRGGLQIDGTPTSPAAPTAPLLHKGQQGILREAA